MPNVKFQPALPLRGVTSCKRCQSMSTKISTRTPLAGSDIIGRHAADIKKISTRTPLAGSDQGACERRFHRKISTRTPLAGSDALTVNARAYAVIFQPALPLRGVTPGGRSFPRRNRNFNPHSPCGE